MFSLRALIAENRFEQNIVVAEKGLPILGDELDLTTLGFNGTTPAVTGRPSYHPGAMLKIYNHRYLSRIPSSRRLERECQAMSS